MRRKRKYDSFWQGDGRRNTGISQQIIYFCAQMENKDNLLGVLGTLYRWRKQLFLLCAAAGIGAAVISLFLPNYFQASTTFLAASPDQAKPEMFFSRTVPIRSEYYGNTADIDRVLTIAESNDLIFFLVDSFDLYTHYDIHPEQYKASYLMRQMFMSLYSVKKNKRDAVELTVEDTDPELAARIANAAREKIEQIARNLLRESQAKTIEAFEDNIVSKERLLLAIGDTLARLRTQFGVYNVVAQTQSLTEQLSEVTALFTRDSVRLQILRPNAQVPRDTIIMLDAKVAGMRQEAKMLETKISRLNSGVSSIYNLEKQYAEANLALSEDRERLKQWKAAYHSQAPAVLLVEAAETPVVKSRPRRSVLVLAFAFAAFLFGVIGVLLFEAYRNINWREVIAKDN
jgi:tyrosine-protein kinase Etk/Wzc